MKKLLAMLCCAAFVGGVQAVQLNWSGTANQGGGTVTLDSLDQSFAIALSVTLTGTGAVSNNASILTVNNDSGAASSNGIVWYNGNGGALGAHIGSRWLDGEGPKYVADGDNSHSVILSFERQGDGWNIVLSIDGVTVPNQSGSPVRIGRAQIFPICRLLRWVLVKAIWPSISMPDRVKFGRLMESPSMRFPSRRSWPCSRLVWPGWHFAAAWPEFPTLHCEKGPLMAPFLFQSQAVFRPCCVVHSSTAPPVARLPRVPWPWKVWRFAPARSILRGGASRPQKGLDAGGVGAVYCEQSIW